MINIYKQKITRNQLDNRLESQQLPEIDGSPNQKIIHSGAWSDIIGSFNPLPKHQEKIILRFIWNIDTSEDIGWFLPTFLGSHYQSKFGDGPSRSWLSDQITGHGHSLQPLCLEGRRGLPASRPGGDRHEDFYCVQSQKRHVIIFVLVMLVTVRYSWGKKHLPSLQPKKQRHEQIMQINFVLRLTNTTGSPAGGSH